MTTNELWTTGEAVAMFNASLFPVRSARPGWIARAVAALVRFVDGE